MPADPGRACRRRGRALLKCSSLGTWLVMPPHLAPHCPGPRASHESTAGPVGPSLEERLSPRFLGTDVGELWHQPWPAPGWCLLTLLYICGHTQVRPSPKLSSLVSLPVSPLKSESSLLQSACKHFPQFDLSLTFHSTSPHFHHTTS